MTRLSIGISTCPNDTFAFHALLERRVDAHGLELEFVLADVEELNEALHAGRLDVAKVSAHAALAHAREVVALPVGWALGRGVGPVVLAPATPPERGARELARVLCPGRWTTATLLWRLFHPEPVVLEQRLFSEIVPALEAGQADLGVCIHEGRFTWQRRGLRLVEDLGETWERATGDALPLGGPVARAELGAELTGRVVRAIRASLAHALTHREETLPTLRRHAQEEEDEVLWKHVDLYVNAWTEELGETGRGAFRALSRLARERGLLPAGAGLGVFEGV